MQIGKYQFHLKRVIVGLAGIPMAFGFMKQAWHGALTSEMFLTFPLGIVILYSPQLAIHLLEIWKGMRPDEEHNEKNQPKGIATN